jgi:hypothetical protein
MAVYHMLDTRTGDVILPVATNAGAPTSGTSGTLAGIADIGSLLIDNTNGVLYQNTNTIASPTWTAIIDNGGTFGSINISGLATLTGGLAMGAGSVTASTTHSIAGATALKPLSIVVCANANDAVKLPVATLGLVYTVITVGAAATPAIYPGQAGDQIDAVAAGSPTTLTAAHRGATFYCDTAGHWTSALFGAVAT